MLFQVNTIILKSLYRVHNDKWFARWEESIIFLSYGECVNETRCISHWFNKPSDHLSLFLFLSTFCQTNEMENQHRPFMSWLCVMEPLQVQNLFLLLPHIIQSLNISVLERVSFSSDLLRIPSTMLRHDNLIFFFKAAFARWKTDILQNILLVISFVF